MARGLELKKTKALDLIVKVYSEHPLWGAPEVHKEIFARLHDKNDLYYEPYLDDPNWPRENTVYQHLKIIREKDKARPSESKELDRPWSMSALTYYDIPPEALPVVMQAWAKALEQDKPLTIRQAKWVAHIYCILGNIDGLTERASEFANREKAIELTGTYPDKPDDMWFLWYTDAILYLMMTGDDSLFRMVMKSLGWQTTATLADLKAIFKIEQKEAHNERVNTYKG